MRYVNNGHQNIIVRTDSGTVVLEPGDSIELDKEPPAYRAGHLARVDAAPAHVRRTADALPVAVDELEPSVGDEPPVESKRGKRK